MPRRIAFQTERPALRQALRVLSTGTRYALAMSPRNFSWRSVPAPLPLSYQWWYFRPWRGAWYWKLNLQSDESVKHENVAVGPKNVAMKTSVSPQFAGQVAFGSNVPPEIVPIR